MRSAFIALLIILAPLITVFGTGCSTAYSRPVHLPSGHPTYAIIAFDDQGVISQTDLTLIRARLAEALIERGYVRRSQILVDDPLRAEIIFRVKVAWIDDGEGFAVTEIVPSYGGGSTYYIPAPAYASDYPWMGRGSWCYDPWSDDWYYYGCGYYPWGPYTILMPVCPWIPYHGFGRHHRLPPGIAHLPPPPQRPIPPRQPSPPWWGRGGRHYGDYNPRGPDHAVRPPLATYEPSARRNERPAPPARHVAPSRLRAVDTTEPARGTARPANLPRTEEPRPRPRLGSAPTASSEPQAARESSQTRSSRTVPNRRDMSAPVDASASQPDRTRPTARAASSSDRATPSRTDSSRSQPVSPARSEASSDRRAPSRYDSGSSGRSSSWSRDSGPVDRSPPSRVEHSAPVRESAPAPQHASAPAPERSSPQPNPGRGDSDRDIR